MSIKNTFNVLIILFTLLACAGSPDISDKLLKSKYSNVSPADALDTAEQRFDAAKDEKLGFYAPSNFMQAKKALDEAKKKSKRNKKNKKILRYTYLVEQHLDKAVEVKILVEKTMPAVLTLKRSLDDLHLTDSFLKTYDDLLKDTGKLTAEIEKNAEFIDNLSKKDTFKAERFSKNMAALVAKLEALEIQVVEHNALDDSKVKLADAVKDNAKKFTPKSYADTVAAQTEAEEFIAQHVHDKAGIQAVAGKFRFEVDHLINVAKAVTDLLKLDKKSYENEILKREDNLLVISKALGHEDVRDKPLDKQVKIIGVAITDLVGSNTDKTKAIVEKGDIEKALHNELAQQKRKASEQTAVLEQEVAKLNLELTTARNDNLPLQETIKILRQNVAALSLWKAALEGKQALIDQQMADKNKVNSSNKEIAVTDQASAPGTTPAIAVDPTDFTAATVAKSPEKLKNPAAAPVAKVIPATEPTPSAASTVVAQPQPEVPAETSVPAAPKEIVEVVPNPPVDIVEVMNKKPEVVVEDKEIVKTLTKAATKE